MIACGGKGQSIWGDGRRGVIERDNGMQGRVDVDLVLYFELAACVACYWRRAGIPTYPESATIAIDMDRTQPQLVVGLE